MVICPANIDADVWASLPAEIQLEIQMQMELELAGPARVDGSMCQSASVADLSSFADVVFGRVPHNVDASVWRSLPDNIRAELSIQPDSQLNTTLQNTWSLSFNTGRRPLLCLPPMLSYQHNQQNAYRFSVSPLAEEINASDPTPCASSTDQWTDVDFPPDASSLDGIKTDSSIYTAAETKAPSCQCIPAKPARLKTVLKENKNQGRKFFGCAASKCNFFSWAAPAQLHHTAQNISIRWQRIHWNPETEMRKTPPHPSQIRQGRVGDCWFISALAVLSESPELISRVFPSHQPLSYNGIFSTFFFIDGKWRSIYIDNYFAISPPPNSSKRSVVTASSSSSSALKSNDIVLHFSKSVAGSLWVPILEKAYAKAHSSYAALNGGWVAEALFDLTGFPTLTVDFGGVLFNSENFWVRLISFASQGFLMGASCPVGGDGLVGGHAYSVLRVVEKSVWGDEGVTVGKQPQDLRDYFSSSDNHSKSSKSGKNGFDEVEEFGVTENGMLRLIKLRNPWGRVEWKGKFGINSAEMNGGTLKKRLNDELDCEKGSEGVFWMTYHDFLQRFMSVDVCFTLKDHQVLNVESILSESSSIAEQAIELLVPDPSWINISICQRTKRGKPNENFYYTDISILIISMADNDNPANAAAHVEDVRLFGHGRDSHFDLFLGDRGKTRRYLLIPFSIERETAKHEASKNVSGMTRVGSGEWGHLRNMELKRVEFTVRILSANTVGVCKLDMKEADFVWNAFDRGICDSGLITRKNSYGSLRLTQNITLDTWSQIIAPDIASNHKTEQLQIHPWPSDNFTFRILQTTGIALVHVTNTHASISIKVRMQLRAATKTFSSTVAHVWRIIPPKSRKIVGVCVCPCSEAVCGHELVSIDNVEWNGFFSKTRCECSADGMFQPWNIE
ncbi:Calpain-type cysteine protease dek1 [Physocladia obscura]|uniref:Calpain-type cysteine protease dek1 n=1 Tax=Physocladia obscura TaxID=109957 RepID=A0AAD5XIG2_9FUNG|nr:Calpain-type cysteine protease dek1 [Physocladia obscura]